MDESSERFQRGEGGHFQSNDLYGFGNFNQAFLSMKFIQKSNFRAQGMFDSRLEVQNQCAPNWLRQGHQTLFPLCNAWPTWL